jgi:anti-sigma B factor antagonist
MHAERAALSLSTISGPPGGPERCRHVVRLALPAHRSPGPASRVATGIGLPGRPNRRYPVPRTAHGDDCRVIFDPDQLATEVEVKKLPAASVQALKLPKAEVLSVEGRVTYHNAARLRGVIFAELKDGAKRLVIELGSVEAMDTAGVAVLVEAVQAGRKHGREVLLCTPSETVMRIFRLAGLSDVLESCHATPDDLWQRLQESASSA